MAMQTGRVQLIIASNLIARLTRGKPSVNFGALDMLTCGAFSGHATHLLLPFHFRPPGHRGLSRNRSLYESHSATISGRASHPLQE
jgi:hypothetical protein